MLNEELNTKYKNLINNLKDLESVCVAFSGGVDSTLLLYAAREALGDNVIAVTTDGQSLPSRELEWTIEFCEKYGIRHERVKVNELAIKGFAENPTNRCYHCKRSIFRNILDVAKKNGFKAVVEGSNVDDEGDYRPGMRALKELNIISPLKDAALNKNEIRELSGAFDLPTQNKPSAACLASRFVYGERITEDKLKMVEKAEDFLHDMGFVQLRVRIHGDMARIETLPEDCRRLMEDDIRTRVYKRLKEIGFSYVTADLMGYRTGSMNEVI